MRSEIQGGNIADVVSLDELQNIQDSLARLSGLSIVIFGLDGNPITKHTKPFVRFCEKVIRSTDAGREACRKHDMEHMKIALDMVKSGKIPQAYRCHAGLWDFVAPIMIDDRVFGYLWCGRVRSKEDGDILAKDHEMKAKKYGINPEEYAKALREAPVLSKQEIESSARIVYLISRAIASQVYQTFSDLLERTQELRILSKSASLIVEESEPRSVLRSVMGESKAAIGADCLCLYRYDDRSGRFDEPITAGFLHDQEAMRDPTTERSTVWNVLDKSESVFAEDAKEVLDAPFVEREQIASCAAFPLRVQKYPIGVLLINYRSKQKFSHDRQIALDALANQVAIAIAYHRVLEGRWAKSEQLSHLHDSVASVLKGASLDKVFEDIVKRIRDGFGFDGVVLHLVEERENRICGKHAGGVARDWLEESVYLLDRQNVLADVWRNGEHEVISGPDPRFNQRIYREHKWKDWIRVFMPVKCPDRTVGVLEAGYLLKNRREIEDEELNSLESFVQHAGLAIYNARWLLRSRALLNVAEVLAHKRDTSKILKEIVSQTLQVVPCNVCSVNLRNKKTGLLEAVISESESGHKPQYQTTPQQLLNQQTFDDQEPVVFADPWSGPQHLIVPILSGDQALGTISLTRYGLVQFTDLDVEWMTTVANHVGTALERTELLDRYEQLVDSEKAIVQRLPLDMVLNEIAAHAAQTLDVPLVHVMLVDEDRLLPIRASIGFPKDFSLPMPMSIGSGLSGYVAKTREIYQTINMVEDERTLNREYLAQLGHVSYLGAPMIHRDELLGVLDVHTEHSREFTSDEIKVFRSFADLAAIAVSNARSYDQAIREFESLASAGSAVSSALGLEQVLDDLLEAGCRLVEADGGCVRIVDDTETLVPRAQWPSGARTQKPRTLRKGEGIAGRVWETGKPYIVPDASVDIYFWRQYDDVASELAVPIMVQDHVIGVLSVSSKRKSAFQQRHERSLLELAKLSATAIEKNNLLSALREVAQATLSMKPDDFLRLVIDKARGLVSVICAPSIWFLDEPNQVIYYAAGGEDDPFKDCDPLPLEGSISGAVVKTRRPITVVYISRKSLYYYRDIAQKAGLKSLLSFPIMAGEKPVGVFNVHTYKRHKFQDWEINVLSAFAAQAGVAIEVNRTLTRLRLLQQYAEELTSARNLAEVSERVVRYALKAVDADTTALWLYDSYTRKFEYGSSIDLTVKGLRRIVPRPGGLSERILSTGKWEIVNDASKTPPDMINPNAIELGIQALAGFPLIVGEKRIGVLYVDFLHPYYYTTEQMNTLNAMAQLAAVAVDNARSIEARQNFLMNVTHDLKAPLSAVDAQFQIVDTFGYEPGVIKKTQGEIRRLTRVVENLLGLLRSEHAAKPLKREQVDLLEMLSNVEDMWSALVEKRRLTVSVELDKELSLIQSDPDRIHCIVFNLLDNAVKFARQGGYVLVKVTGNEDYFTISVEDDGPGMSKEQIERFELSAGQVPMPYWEEIRSGVGYAAVRKSVAEMGGELSISSSRNEGTRVTVRLPFLVPGTDTRRWQVKVASAVEGH
jgi:GAF domain-containing protein/ligand-binding sensor protein/anti-sigma regulatory factor (Ser/Thr protein kinase)